MRNLTHFAQHTQERRPHLDSFQFQVKKTAPSDSNEIEQRVANKDYNDKQH